MDMSHRWKCIYLITCFRQGFPGLKYTVNSVTQLQSCWQPLGIALLCSKQSQGRELWATAPPAEPRRLGAFRCRKKHHGATTSLWMLHWVPGLLTKPQKEHLPGSQPRLQQGAAAPARSLWARGCTRSPSAGREGSSQGCTGGFCAATTAPAMKGLGCVSGEEGQAESLSASIFPTKHDSGCHPRDGVAPLEKAKRNYKGQPIFSKTPLMLLCFPVNSILAFVSKVCYYFLRVLGRYTSANLFPSYF